MSGIKPLALQLYSLREALAQDFEGIVRQVADMGYVGVEPYGGMPWRLGRLGRAVQGAWPASAEQPCALSR